MRKTLFIKHIKQIFAVGKWFKCCKTENSLNNVDPYRALFSPYIMGEHGVHNAMPPGGRGFNPRRGRQHSFVETDHEIFSTVILSLPLIQE